MIRRIPWLLPLLLACRVALAGQAVLDADTRVLRQGQAVDITLTVVDARPTQTPVPPRVDGLRLDYQGQRQSTVMVNFHTTRTFTFSYLLTAIRPGRYTIPSFRVSTSEGPMASNSLPVSVLPREGGPEADGLFATLGTNEVRVGQVVVWHLVFRTRRRLLDLRLAPPSFEGFVPEQGADQAQKQYDVREDGATWHVVEVDTPLLATAPGVREIPPASLTAQFAVASRRRGWPDDFFGGLTDSRTEVFGSDPIPVTVRPLPVQGRPADWSGLVGDFEVGAELSAATVAAGETATMTVTITGDGTLSGFRLPAPPEDAGFRAYDDDPEIQSSVRGGRFQAVGRLRRAIVPARAGTLEIPPVRFSAWSPSASSYVELSTPALRLEVKPGTEAAAPLASFAPAADRRREVASQGDDILPLHPDATLRSQVFRPLSPGVLGVAVLPHLGWLAAVLGAALRRRSGPSPKAALKARVRRLHGGDPAEIEGVFREALGLALHQPPAKVDRETIAAGLSGARREEALAVYREIEHLRYGGGGAAEDLAARVATISRKLLELA